jgi:hypothetical protein
VRYVYGVKIHGKEMGWDAAKWILLARDTYKWWAVVNMAMNLRIP